MGVIEGVSSFFLCCMLRSFRDATFKVAKTNFADEWNKKRVEFIPVEWRSGLSLDNGMCIIIIMVRMQFYMISLSLFLPLSPSLFPCLLSPSLAPPPPLFTSSRSGELHHPSGPQDAKRRGE